MRFEEWVNDLLMVLAWLPTALLATRRVSAGLQPSWGPIGVELAFGLAVLTAIGRSLRARQVVRDRYGPEPQLTRAGIEGDSIIPELARLISDTSTLALESKQTIQDVLNQFRYRDVLDTLNTYYTDIDALTKLPHDIVRWIRLQSLGLLLLLVGSVLVIAPFAVQRLDLPPAVNYMGTICLVAGTTLTAVFYLLETQAGNRLASLLDKYVVSSSAGQ